MTPHRLEWHLKFGARFSLWLLQTVELPVGCHDPTTGRRADLDALAFECRVDAILTQQGILLKLADLVANLERGFARPLVRLWLGV